MAHWAQIAEFQPELASRVRRCFAVRRHATLATLRHDGSPRISGVEVDFSRADDVYLGMMPGSYKALDLERDPRFALHCPTVDPPTDEPTAWLGDAKMAGLAVEESARTDIGGSHRFRLDIMEVVVTSIAPSADRLVIQSWHPGRGLEVKERR